ncbi:cache domain-containing protein [Neptunomonas japonica]|uniref:Signal transduction protein n=1 Tax=Neptunomonas japonica JAMM 1380 TaxID=1441457 RepID=A0A7R6SU77_9GAMM|nr:cache domain-containing protein [Neptunomonas japonica]BBB28060.1 signal transduction protein [Neptunomonas japonica JAMM 1380]
MKIISDQKLIRLIKVAPVLVVGIFIVLLSTITIYNNHTKAKSDITSLRDNFMDLQKAVAKSQVNQVFQDIQFEKSQTKSTLKNDIKQRVHEAYAIAKNIYQQNKDKPEAEVTQLITDSLRRISFNGGRGYFFIYKTNGINVMHPLLPQMEGTSKWDLKDIRGRYIVREMGELVKTNGESFYHWWFVKPQNKNDEFEKIGFGKYFAPYDWFIGTGEYLIDVENDIKSRLLKRISNIRYGDNGYVFVIDYQGNYLSHFKKSLVGTNNLDGRGANGFPFVRKIIQTAQQGGDYVQYIGSVMPTTGQPAKKISYVKGITDWNWAIGTGVYIKEVENYLLKREAIVRGQNKDELQKILLLSFLATLILIVVLVYLSRSISKRFERFQQHISSNIDELQRTKDQLHHVAHHDALTQLPNRLLLKERITQGIERSKHSGTQFALMFVDLDDFKKINDLYGHSTGDELLQAVSHEFEHVLQAGDSIIRFGGDEFIFCFPELQDLRAAEKKVERIQSIFRNSFSIAGKVIHSSCSIGVTMYPDDGDDPEKLISKSDIVLYKSKARQKGGFLFFNTQINQQVHKDLQVESALRLALKNNEISVVYQPQILIQSGKIHGVEALVRWNSEQLGQISPVDFIGIAEDTGLIHEIGMFVLEQSLADISYFNTSQEHPIALSVNLSPRQLNAPQFVENLVTTVSQHDLDNQLITLEITESLLIEDLTYASPILQQLRDHGFNLSLDDFGTGYSSLSYLSNLPINEIKIDRSFVDKLLTSSESDNLVRAIIAIGESYRLTMVAEGVETAEQLAQLSNYHCHIAQGYYFDRPLSLTDLSHKYSAKISS